MVWGDKEPTPEQLASDERQRESLWQLAERVRIAEEQHREWLTTATPRQILDQIMRNADAYPAEVRARCAIALLQFPEEKI